MWYYQHCQHCLCSAWMLCAECLCRSFQRRTAKNVDFVFLKALKSTNVEPEQGTLLIYDIACQHFVHFHDHINPKIPFRLQVEAAIGLFHVHAHKDECFFQYATSFILGASVIAGEILESLWSLLNSISPTARTATLAHQAEMLDDHASNSNHRKLLSIVSNLCKCHQTATNMVESAQLYYNKLTSQSGPMAIAKRTSDIEGQSKPIIQHKGNGYICC